MHFATKTFQACTRFMVPAVYMDQCLAMLIKIVLCKWHVQQCCDEMQYPVKSMVMHKFARPQSWQRMRRKLRIAMKQEDFLKASPWQRNIGILVDSFEDLFCNSILGTKHEKNQSFQLGDP